MRAMPACVCVDASFAIKLAVAEEHSAVAEVLWRRWSAAGTRFCAPVLFVWECANALRRATVANRITADEATAGLELLTRLPIDLVTLEHDILEIWRDFIMPLDLPTAYDAAYLAAATTLGCDLWTADERLIRQVAHEFPWVRGLAEEAREA